MPAQVLPIFWAVQRYSETDAGGASLVDFSQPLLAPQQGQ